MWPATASWARSGIGLIRGTFFLPKPACSIRFFLRARSGRPSAFWRGGRRDPLATVFVQHGRAVVPDVFRCSVFTAASRPIGSRPSIVPLFCLMAVYWDAALEGVASLLKPLPVLWHRRGNFCRGAGARHAIAQQADSPAACHARLDVLHRVRGWKETAQIVGQARQQYGSAGQAGLYHLRTLRVHLGDFLLSARSKSRGDDRPDGFLLSHAKTGQPILLLAELPRHTGQNALFVREIDKPRFRVNLFSADGLSRWWNRSPCSSNDVPPTRPFPPKFSRNLNPSRPSASVTSSPTATSSAASNCLSAKI